MKWNFGKSLYSSMLGMTVLPMAALGIILSFFCIHNFANAMHGEVQNGMQDICRSLLITYDALYEGDYALTGETHKVMVKGENVISGDYEILDRMKAETGLDLSIFYYDTRVLTTIVDGEGNRIIGTGCSAVVMRDVYEAGAAAFYKRARIDGETYFAYYEPLYNQAGVCVGMIGAGRPEEKVKAAVRRAVAPMLLIVAVAIGLAGAASIYFAKKIVGNIQSIQNFLFRISQGNFSAALPPPILKREDELGMMGRAVMEMQKALRHLIEKDALTNLYNRRYGDARMLEVQKKSKISGLPFAIAIGDIDFFKKVNDTYGHAGGDLVLQEVAGVLRRCMVGKGYAIRWGGEEFLLLFRQLNGGEALECVQEALEEVRALSISYGGEIIHITMTFGVKEGNTVERIEALVREADDLLYYGKMHGRNQVISGETVKESMGRTESDVTKAAEATAAENEWENLAGEMWAD